MPSDLAAASRARAPKTRPARRRRPGAPTARTPLDELPGPCPAALVGWPSHQRAVPSPTDSPSATTPAHEGTLRHRPGRRQAVRLVVDRAVGQRTAAAHCAPVRIITPSTSAWPPTASGADAATARSARSLHHAVTGVSARRSETAQSGGRRYRPQCSTHLGQSSPCRPVRSEAGSSAAGRSTCGLLAVLDGFEQVHGDVGHLAPRPRPCRRPSPRRRS